MISGFNLYSYCNILVIGAVLIFVSFIVDLLFHLTVSLLTVIFFALLLFICICNTVLLMREGFRIKHIVIYILTAVYFVVSYFVYFGYGFLPQSILPLIAYYKLLMSYFEATVLAIWIMGYAVLKIKASYDKDYIIILGCSISKKGLLRPLLKRRVNRAIHFAWEQEIRNGKTAYYVPSGGKGDDEPLSEGSAMELYLLSHGAEETEVFPEKKSKNTKENIEFSKKIIEGLKSDAKIGIVTSDFHVLRSGMLAKKEGLDAQVIGSESKWYFWPTAFFRETVAIIFMHKNIHLIAVFICAVIAFAI